MAGTTSVMCVVALSFLWLSDPQRGTPHRSVCGVVLGFGFFAPHTSRLSQSQNDDRWLQIGPRVITMAYSLSTASQPTRVCRLQTHFKSVHKHQGEGSGAKELVSGGAVLQQRGA